MTAPGVVIRLDTWRSPAPGVRFEPVERKGHRFLTADARARLTEDLLELAKPSKGKYQDLATRYGVSVRTVQNVLGESRADDKAVTVRGHRIQHPVPDDALALVAERGSVKRSWVVLCAEGRYAGDYTTYTRRLNSRFGANVVRGARRGTAGMNKDVYLQVQRSAFMRRFSIDLFSLRMTVLDGDQRLNPTGMFIREDHTGLIVGAHVFESDQVTAGMVANLLGQAFVGVTYELPNGPVHLGGLPTEVLCDNGSQFSAEELREGLVPLGVDVANINSYASNENGKHERQHGTLRAQLLKSLPGSNDGAQDARGQFVDTRELLTLQDVRGLIARWTWAHNSVATSTDEPTPLDRWNEAADREAVRTASVDEVAHLALKHPKTCKQYRYGVLLKTKHYAFPKLSEQTATSFIVGTWAGDADHVEIFDRTGTRWLGRATYNPARTAAEEQNILKHRATERTTVKAARRLANERDPLVRPDLPALPIVNIPAPSAPEHDRPKRRSAADVFEELEGTRKQGLR